MSTSNQFNIHLHPVLLACLVSLSLGGCSSSQINLDPNKSVHEAVDAATGPLEDLNIKQRDIPPKLLKAAEAPYALPKPMKCATIRTEIGELDALLGPDIRPEEVQLAANDKVLSDIQNMELPDSEALTSSGIDLVHDKLMSMIQGQTSILPFRSIVRSVTGANRYQKKLENAYQAGKLRRAYLKGLAQSKFGDTCLSKPILPAIHTEPPADSFAPNWDIKTPELPIKL